MNVLMSLGQSAFEWVWRTSMSASVLILLVLMARRFLERWLAPRLCYALSLLVLIRLLLPFAPASSLSLENLLRPEPLSVEKAVISFIPDGSRSAPASPATQIGDGSLPAPTAGASPARQVSRLGAPGLVWAVVFLGLLALAVWRYARWHKLIRTARPVHDARVTAILHQALTAMRVRRPVRVAVVGELDSPAVFGLARVHLLLPEAALEGLNDQELRMVFLHEMAHVRMNDLVLNFVLIGVQFLHWFNPLVWAAVRGIRADRELVCDALVMEQTAPEDHPGYGKVLIKLMDGLPARNRAPFGAIPVLGGKSDFKRRITMIKYPRKAAWGVRAATVLVAVALVGGTFTQAQSRKESPAPARHPLGAQSSTNWPESWTNKFFPQLRRGGTEEEQVKAFVAATHERGVVTSAQAIQHGDGRPEFVLTLYPNNNPLERLMGANQHPDPAAWSFPASGGLASAGAMLSQCMEVTGTRYLVDLGADCGSFGFGFTNTINGFEFVALVEGALQTNRPDVYDAVRHRPRRENLILIRESPGIVKVIPTSRLADYQKAGLIIKGVKP